jgi:hypothetical protein
VAKNDTSIHLPVDPVKLKEINKTVSSRVGVSSAQLNGSR